jgi:hypothetical protein
VIRYCIVYFVWDFVIYVLSFKYIMINKILIKNRFLNIKWTTHKLTPVY